MVLTGKTTDMRRVVALGTREAATRVSPAGIVFHEKAAEMHLCVSPAAISSAFSRFRLTPPGGSMP